MSTEHKPNNSRIVCADGVSLSVQASQFHYCSPRDDKGHGKGAWQNYNSVEVGYIENKGGVTCTPPEDWREHSDGSEFPNDVYAYVPTAMVEAFIAEHGGYYRP